MNSGLELRDVDAVRGGRTLFRCLNLCLSPGQLLHVQGPNGAGKTTLLRLICGLFAPTRGLVLWQGQSVMALREEWGRQLVYVGHAAALKDELSPLENLHVATVLGGVIPDENDATDALAQAGLTGYRRVPVRHLSQGQRRRVALARLALSVVAPLWVLDEPFNALDTEAVTWLQGLMAAQLERGGIVVLTSHQTVSFGDTRQQVVVSL